MPTAEIIEIHCTYDPETKSGTAGSGQAQSQGKHSMAFCTHAQQAKVRLYDRLFVACPSRRGREGLQELSQSSFKKNYHRLCGTLAQPGSTGRTLPVRAPRLLHRRPERYRAGKPVFNRAVTLRDSWGKTLDIREAARNHFSAGRQLQGQHHYDVLLDQTS